MNCELMASYYQIQCRSSGVNQYIADIWLLLLVLGEGKPARCYILLGMYNTDRHLRNCILILDFRGQWNVFSLLSSVGWLDHHYNSLNPRSISSFIVQATQWISVWEVKSGKSVQKMQITPGTFPLLEQPAKVNCGILIKILEHVAFILSLMQRLDLAAL